MVPRGPKDRADSGALEMGRYRIGRTLGEGGMGIVYAAEDERLGRPVAIKKILQTTADPRARERLWREARSAAAVNHPNICQIYEVGESEGEPYIVMELLQGESLADRVRRGPLFPAEASRITLEILAALDAIHQRGWVHRDLKPSNVFLTEHGAKLLDFGLARWTQAFTPAGGTAAIEGAGGGSVTLTGVLVGTPGYMSPEQLDGRDPDARSDLFAAGAILFEMLSRPAFSGSTAIQVYHSVLYENPPALAGSDAITALYSLVQRALAKRPEGRFQTAGEMIRQLQTVPSIAPVSQTDGPVRVRTVTRLIVLPFRLLRPDPEIEYLSFSLADAITCSLSGLDSLVVRSSLTASRYAGEVPPLDQLAAEADVDTLLCGTLLRAGEQIRVNTQLVTIPAGTLLWSHTAQASHRDIFALEEELKRHVVESLALPLSDREQKMLRRDVSNSPTAYEFFLRGNQQGHGPTHWTVARDLYQRSVEEDPNFAPAWVRLARAHWLLGKYTRDGGPSLAEAESALNRALGLNADLPMAHNLYAHIEISSGRAMEAMARLLRRARVRTGDPDIFAGLVMACRFCGLLEASAAAHETARRLDTKIATSVTQTYLLLGRHDEALAEAGSDIGYIDAQILVHKGQPEEALRRLRQREREQDDSNVQAWLVSLRAQLEGKHDESLAALEQLAANFGDAEGMYWVARGLVQLDRLDRALEVLQTAVDGGFWCARVYAEDPQLAPLRALPAFRGLKERAEARRRQAVGVFIEEDGPRLLGCEAPS